MTRRPGWLLLLLLAPASALLGQIQITNTSPLPEGYIGLSYGYNFTATTQPGTYAVTWSTQVLTAPSLPPGLTLASNGFLSGTPTGTGTFTFTVIASGDGFTSTMQFSLTIATPTVIINTASPLPNAIVGQSYSVLLSASSNPAGVVWPETRGLPPGITLSLNGILSGVPTTPGTYTFNLTAEIQSTSISTTMTFSLTVYAGQVVIQTTVLPQAVVGKAYSATLSATPQELTWTLSGLLPAGITFNTATGVFNGISGVTGTFPLQVTASLTNYASASQNLILYVTTGPLAFTQTALPPGVQGSPYTTTVAISGGLPPYQWTFLNPSNDGLSIGASTGIVSGTPTAAGSFLFQVSVTDGTGTTINNVLNLSVATPLSVGTQTLPNGTIGVAYSQIILAAGGTSPYSWIIVGGSGSPAPGLALSTAGTLSGTPATGGSYSFTVQVTDSGGRTATRSLTLSINVGSLSITTSSLPSGQLTVPYSQTVAATGGVLPYTWQLANGSGLPPGLTLNPSTGVISGKPTALGTITFTVQVTDSSPAPLTAQKAFSINIGLTLTITTLSLPAGTQGVAYPSTPVAANGGTPPYTWSIASGALPPGLSLGVSSGAITGTPTATGSTVFTVVVTDSAGVTASQQLSLSINSATAPLAITTSGTYPAPLAVAFTLTLAATGGTPPYTWSATGLPAGLQVSSGVISGTPTASGTANVALTVTDSKQQTATGAVAIDVSPPPSVSIGTISNGAATQAPPVVTLSSPYPAAITGTLTASFQSSVGGSPTEVGFVSSSGGRVGVIQFTIPANGTTAVFQNSPVLDTGTVAGTITIAASITNSVTGANITPSPAPSETIVIQPAPPVIENVTFSNSGGALTVSVVGYSTTRDMASGQFQFYTATGPILTPVTVQLGTAFSTWYSSSSSNQYGSQFTVTIPFTVSGNVADLVSVNGMLTNSQGNSGSLKTVPAN